MCLCVWTAILVHKHSSGISWHLKLHLKMIRTMVTITVINIIHKLQAYDMSCRYFAAHPFHLSVDTHRQVVLLLWKPYKWSHKYSLWIKNVIVECFFPILERICAYFI